MLENDSRSLVAGVAGLGLVFLLTLPSLLGVASHLRESKQQSGLYEDEDGVATEKSVAAFSAKIPKIFLSVFAILGLGTSIALAALETLAAVDVIEAWVNVAQWVGTSKGDQSCRADICPVSDPDSNGRDPHDQELAKTVYAGNLCNNLVNFPSCSSPLPGWSHH
jgi:hypothetical protein